MFDPEKSAEGPTMQEVLEVNWQAWGVGNEPLAKDAAGFCEYRQPGTGLACGIGRVLPDRIVSEFMSSLPVRDAIEKYESARDWFSKCDVEFLVEIQRIHDHDHVEPRAQRYRDLAARYNLTIPPTEEEIQASYPKTNQEAFDRAWEWFVVQKKPAAWNGAFITQMGRTTGLCVYRGGVAGELRCAVGCQIHDADYDPKMEGTGAALLMQTSPVLRDRFADINRAFLQSLQTAHDEVAKDIGLSPEAFQQGVEANLRCVAKNYDLTIPGGQ